MQSLVLNPVPRSAAPAPNPPPWPVSPQVPCAECLLCWQPRQELRGLGEQAREGAHAPSVQRPAATCGARGSALHGPEARRTDARAPELLVVHRRGARRIPGLHRPDARSTLPRVPRGSRRAAPSCGVLDSLLSPRVPVQVAPQRGAPEGPPGPSCLSPFCRPFLEASTPGRQGSRCPSPSGSARPPVSCGLSSWALAEGQMLTAEAPPGPHRLQRAGVAASHQNRGRAFAGTGGLGAEVSSALPAKCSVTLVYK